MWTLLAAFSALTCLANGYLNKPCPKYGCPLAPPVHLPFVPAPPGSTPKCVKPGFTFCESADEYPRQLIKFLIDQRAGDFEDFLRDESADDFSAQRKRPDYEEYGYDYPRPSAAPQLYPQTLPQEQSAGSRYRPPSNSTAANRYLPAREASANPFFAQSAMAGPYRGVGYQASAQQRPSTRSNGFFNPNESPWARNPRGVAVNLAGPGQPAPGYTPHQNPLLAYANLRSRAKRQSDSNSVSICPTRSQFVSPKAALNNQGNWMFVVNLEEQTKSQLVKSEICISDTCDGLCSLPLGYSSKCQQQYVQKRLVALEGNGNRLYTDVFWFPHGCMCQVTLDY